MKTAFGILWWLVAGGLPVASSAKWSADVDFGGPPELGGPAEFTYNGELGPQNWARLSSDYYLCGEGLQQSPVNLPEKPNGVPGELFLNWAPLANPVTVSNNGHTYQVSVAGNAAGNSSYATYRNKIYQFSQFHFHGSSPSEHHINGSFSSMEMHAVHAATDGALLVVAILLDYGVVHEPLAAPAKLFSNLFGTVPLKVSVVNVSVDVQFSGDYLLGGVDTNDFWAYPGSLTTPPCTESVQWVVLGRTAVMDRYFLRELFAMFGFSARFTQDLNGRF